MSESQTTKRSVLGSPVLRRIVLTLVPGGIAYAVTTLFKQDQIWAIMLATFIGGVALVVQFLAEFDDRLRTVEVEHAGRVHALEELQRRHTAEIERVVREGFTKVNDATRLFSLVEASALRTEVVTQFVKHSTQIGPTPPLIFDLAQAEIGRMSDFLREVATGGDVTYEGEDRDWLIGLTRHAQKTIHATSLTTVDGGGTGYDGGLWTSDLGHRYLEVQRDAVQRGVVVRRVFVLDRRESAADRGLQQICRIHRELGINVRILDPATLPTVGRNQLFDFILFDGAVSYEVSTGSRIEDTMSPIVVNTRLILGEQRVQQRTARFALLWEAAKEFTG
jgi:hypothetical protein